MDIRTKLALALVSIALLSMLLLGGFAYRVSSSLLQDISARQLDALAESKKQDVLGIIEGRRNNVRLIRSRTQLRIRLRDYQFSKDQQALADMQRIVEDAQRARVYVRRITLFDRTGAIVAMAGKAQSAPQPVKDLSTDVVDFGGFALVDGAPDVIYRAPVYLDGEALGSIEAVFGAVHLAALAANYRGLGETGETMVVGYTPEQKMVLLHPLRHAAVPPVLDPAPDYLVAALGGEERTYISGVRDYRGEPVWAATRYIPDTGWGLIVKVDAAEETAPARQLRGDLIDLGLALGAFALVGGTLLGFWLARPIRDLARVVQRAHSGETSLRANANSDDEIGLLAQTLNNYMDKYGPDTSMRRDDDSGN